MQFPTQQSIPSKAFISSSSFVNSFYKELLLKVFEGVGLENAKRMAPQNAFLQTQYTLQSFVPLAHTQSMKPNLRLIQESDFRPPEIDNLAVQEIQSEKVPEQPRMATITQSAISTKSILLKTKRSTQKSVRSRKFTQLQELKEQTKSKQLVNFQKLTETVDPYDFSQDPQLNKIRGNFLKIQKQNADRQKQLDSLKQKNQGDKQKNEKIVKQMKRITYDYEGKLFGQGDGIKQPEKLMLLKDKQGNAQKNSSKINCNVESTKIQLNRKKDQKSQRKDFKQAPLFRQKAHSIIESIQNAKGISHGVKITEELGQQKSITKQNALKKPIINSLSDFKTSLKNSRFRQYHPTALSQNKSFSTLNNQQALAPSIKLTTGIKRNSLNNKQSKSISSYSLLDSKNKTLELLQDYQSSRANQSILEIGDETQSRSRKMKMKYSGLPFIKSKGFRAVDVGSEKSFKYVVDEGESKHQSRVRSKKVSRILVNDIGLLKTTLEDL